MTSLTVPTRFSSEISDRGHIAGACGNSGHPLLLAALLTCFWAFTGLAVVQDVSAQSTPTVSVERQEALVGKSVDVPVQVSGFTDVGAISLIVTYDPEVLQFAKGVDTKALISGVPRDNFSANVVKPGELRIAWFDASGSSPIKISDGTLLKITFHRYAGGKSPVAFAEGSEVGNMKAKSVKATFQDGQVVGGS